MSFPTTIVSIFVSVFLSSFIALTSFAGDILSVSEATKSRLEALYGVSYHVLDNFAYRLSQSDSFRDEFQKTTSCEGLLQLHTDSERDAFIYCISSLENPFSETVYGLVVRNRLASLKNDGDLVDMKEKYKTVRLLSWVEDALRVGRRNFNLPSNLYLMGPETGEHFSGHSHFKDFDFKDGDIVLTIGKGAISSLIPMVTIPQRRYSHALMVRVRDGEKIVLESLIETGAKKTPWKKFIKRDLFGAVVLRLRDDIPEREKLIAAASDFAYDYAKRRVSYDSAMDMSTDKTLFCSEMIVMSYAKAIQQVITHVDFENIEYIKKYLLPGESKILDGEVGKFLASIGVKNKTMIAPGDLLSSEYLQVVGQYRKTEEINQFYQHIITVDSILEMLKSGKRFAIPSGYKWLKLIGFKVLEFFKKNFTRKIFDLGIVPTTMTRSEIAHIMVYQDEVFKNTVNKFRTYPESNLDILQFPHWHYADTMQSILLNLPENQKFIKSKNTLPFYQ